MITKRRRIIAGALSAVAVLGSLVLASAPAHALDDHGPYCSSNGDTRPCILAASIQTGSTTDPITASSTDFNFGIDPCDIADLDASGDGGCDGEIGWSSYIGTGELSDAQVWTITFDLGAFVPSETDTWGVHTSITRTNAGTATSPDYQLTMTTSPTLIDDGTSCTTNIQDQTVCTGEKAPSTTEDLFGFIDDNNEYATTAYGTASYGLDDWTTSSTTGPPTVLSSTPPGTITIPIGNVHEHADGSVVHGEYNAFLPNALLEYLGIDDPSTITSSSIAVSLESGTTTITPTSTGVNINLSDIIWPEPPGGNIRRAISLDLSKTAKVTEPPLKIARGVITPSKPTSVKAKRVSSTVGDLTFKGARPRGSKIKTYSASCSAKHEKTRTGTSKSRKHLHVSHLHAHVAYRCKVRAVAKAGKGHWSKPVKLKA